MAEIDRPAAEGRADESVSTPVGRREGPPQTSRFRTWAGEWRMAVSGGRRFGAYFFLSAVVIILVFLVYTQIFVVRAMREETRQMIERYAFFYRIATSDTIIVPQSGDDLNIIFDTIQNTNFPLVITDTAGQPQLWKAIEVLPEDNSPEALAEVRNIIRRLDIDNPPYPFEIPKVGLRVLHYGDSDLIKRLSWLPFVALCVIVLFIGVGYVGFQHIKNNEQRSIWVGMARETAHQLGTPLSSLYGWIELMKSELDEAEEEDRREAVQRIEQIAAEMSRDTSRLTKIVSRFSQIGSTPELRVDSLIEVIGDTAVYLKERMSQDIQIVQKGGEIPSVPMNRELLGWALENLLKNAADAMEGRGGRIEVSTETRQTGKCVDITIRDNGRGIPPHMTRQIFLPGYSTKKRGWGLGLAFVKRIVEDYHRGRITVQDSVVGEGTTFLVSLPMAPRETQEAV